MTQLSQEVPVCREQLICVSGATTREKLVKMSVLTRLVLPAALAAVAIPMGGGRPASAQATGESEAYRAAQNLPTPAVELPTPATEADPFPSIENLDDVVPPSLGDEAPAFEASEYSDGDSVYERSVLDEGLQQFENSVEEAIAPQFPQVETALLPDPCCDAPAPIYSTGTWWRRGHWYTQMDFVVMTRDDPRQVGVATDPGIAIYNNTDLVTQHYQPGTRLTLGKFLGRDASLRDHTLEFVFLGFFKWETDRTLVSRQGMSLNTLMDVAPLDPITTPFFNADRQTYSYDTTLNNFELNYQIRTRPGRDQLALEPNGTWVRHSNGSRLVTVLAGMRAMSFRDGVQYTSDLFASGDPTNGRYTVRTHNDMFGVHLGSEFREKYDAWDWGFRGRIGLLVNLADRLSAIRSVNVVNNVPTPSTMFQTVQDEQVTFVGEAGLLLTYQLRPNLHLRAAYDFMILSGLALGAENMFMANGFPEFNLHGSTLVHGGTFGFETTW